MADITPFDRTRKIIAPGYRTEDLPPVTMSREELVDAELGVLRGQVRQLQSVIDGMRGTINIHHEAMSLLQLQVAELEARTLRGRWRRFLAWCRAFGDHVDPPTPDPFAAADANPEAMPKP